MQQANHRVFSFILYFLGFLLFCEWLRPLTAISDTGSIQVFEFFAGFSFLLSYLRVPFWITFPVKILAILFSIHVLFFFNTSVTDPLWFKYLAGDLKTNLIFLFDGNWEGLSGIFRSVLFFILLWIVSYLMHYWLIQTRRLFLFFFITIVYLTVVDTFTMYHADGAIVRTVIIGFLLLGLLRVMKIQEETKVSFNKGFLPISWLVALITTIIFTTVVGYAAPKEAPQWPDPVPFIKKAPNGYGDAIDYVNGAGQKIGYGTDDRYLGGGFTEDQTPVFTAADTQTHYWRIESKDFYTGKGWINSKNARLTKVNTNQINQNPVLQFYGPNVRVSTDQAEITMKLPNFPQLVYSGEPTKITTSGDSIYLDSALGKLEPMRNGRHVTLPKYTLNYDYPTFNVPTLQKDNAPDPQSVKALYLQLPKSLPSRVKKLAEKVTSSANNRYDKALAVVDYFRTNGFKYDTQNVAKPGPKQDYVDQFLFQTKTGYCDNFSTSMVVMLRSVGIPARWVKGFTEGEYQHMDKQGRSVYVVKNSNAHSWVEVYFPNQGWVPFEPTISYSSFTNFTYILPNNGSYTDPATPVTSSLSTEKTTPAQKNHSAKAEKQSKQMKSPNTKTSSSKKKSTHFNGESYFYIMAGILIMLLIFSWLLFHYRLKWLPKWILYRYRSRQDNQVFDDAMKRLLWLLGMFGFEYRESQTLREYAVTIDRSLGSSDMKNLILSYEKVRYKKNQDEQSWRLARVFWENIIKNLKA